MTFPTPVSPPFLSNFQKRSDLRSTPSPLTQLPSSTVRQFNNYPVQQFSHSSIQSPLNPPKGDRRPAPFLFCHQTPHYPHLPHLPHQLRSYPVQQFNPHNFHPPVSLPGSSLLRGPLCLLGVSLCYKKKGVALSGIRMIFWQTLLLLNRLLLIVTHAFRLSSSYFFHR